MCPAPRSAAPLSPQVFQVLLSLHHGSLHGYAIIQDIRDRTQGEVSLTASTLYDALARLLDSGSIEEVEASDTTPSRDSRRRYYRLTRKGREQTRSEIERLERLLATARGTQTARSKGTR